MGKLGRSSITTHSWSPDGTQILIGCKDGTLEIYNVVGTDTKNWTLVSTFREHSQYISSVDWHPYGYFLSTSHDRSVLVWKQDQGRFAPQYVNFRQSRAVLDGKWSNDGDKFVVGCGSRMAALGFFNVQMSTASLEMWTAKLIEELHESSITSVSFEASGLVFASGSTDKSCKIVSAFLEGIDDAKSHSGPFANITTCGEILYSFGPPQLSDWVNHVVWSPDSNWLAFTTHNSIVHFWNREANGMTSVSWEKRPFMQLAFGQPGTVYAGGYDFVPVKFELAGSTWSCKGNIESGKEEAKTGATNSVLARIQKFEAVDKTYTVSTKHKNVINSMKVSNGKLSSTDIQGTVVVWS